MTRRDEVIRAWVLAHRPDIIGQIDQILSMQTGYSKALHALMALAFEAGRKFQAENPAEDFDGS